MSGGKLRRRMMKKLQTHKKKRKPYQFSPVTKALMKLLVTLRRIDPEQRCPFTELLWLSAVEIAHAKIVD